LNRFRTK